MVKSRGLSESHWNIPLLILIGPVSRTPSCGLLFYYYYYYYYYYYIIIIGEDSVVFMYEISGVDH